MCMSCGCMMFDKKTSPDAITMDDIIRIAESHGIEPEEVVYNLGVTLDACLGVLLDRKKAVLLERNKDLLLEEKKDYHKLAK